MLGSDRSDNWRRAFRVELRAEAIGLAFRGWPVLPGTYPVGGHWAGRDGVEDTGPVPVHADWRDRVGTRAEQVATWWTGHPYTLLLATGAGYDAIEVGDDLGRGAARVLRSVGLPVPIIATPEHRWFFLTRSGDELVADLAANADVVHHGEGGWISLPPSPFQHGVVHWRVKPEVCGWQIPSSRVVQDALLDAIQESAGARTRQLVAG
ncbi:bifunctional DNA primase/polymerase [Actinokineospora auranticolor]|uniref:Bifunctional DNA primase/polymerase-like protein n=1 Tax=Actinokineospora auranticolor TaxID=155976 RepID=A0A2S6GKL4_9PSEU|nr:bifunctional DNA primase/polymerase [Actinokineospora auranticolor]PPK65784.1 bifunctional DNA primase/polymerase-like protein [Actinokineospora auranticolor]